MENINYFDIIVISIALLIGLKGLMNGLIKELFGILGIIGGVFLASRYSVSAGEMVNKYLFQLQNEAALNLIGFVTIFISTWIVAYMLGSMLKSMTTLSGLGIFDRFMGFLFGASKVLLIFAVILYALSNVDFIKKITSKYTDNSVVYPYLMEIGNVVVKIDPSTLAQKAKSEASQLPTALSRPDVNITNMANELNRSLGN